MPASRPCVKKKAARDILKCMGRLFVCLALVGCGSDGPRHDGDAGSDVDTDTDTGTGVDPGECADPDERPQDSHAGAPCVVDRDCALGYFCVGGNNGWP